MITTPSGLQYEDTTVGSGAQAQAGQHVHVHFRRPEQRAPLADIRKVE